MAEGQDEALHIILTKTAEMHASALARCARAEGAQMYNTKPLPGTEGGRQSTLRLLEALTTIH